MHAKFHHGGSSGFGEIGTGHTHVTHKRILLLGLSVQNKWYNFLPLYIYFLFLFEQS